ncbi:MAG: iron-containing redox enzyme family protein [Myxococcota bacterium]|nr:iron-containing redox enzyme family protein [Deltaproteobacteria bacterium]MDQ3334976.1 iron-containing redox enzyme family protein [Myxococcota bacterium]
MSETLQFIKALNDEVRRHPAIHDNSFLKLVATKKFSKRAWLGFAQQLYPHVHFFIPYMEEMLLNTFDMNAKLIVAKILLDEYGEDAAGDSHPELFRQFVRACGGAEADASLLTTKLQPETITLVETHMRLCRDEKFLVGLGAIGQAHEFAIAYLFPPLVKGMELAGFTAEEMKFFSLHVDHDVEHSAMLDQAMVRLALTDDDREQIRRGTLASLEARKNLWAAMERRMVGIDNGDPPATSERSLVDVTRDYKNVPDHFWPA